MTKVILYIATSLDGFIADKEGGVDWLPHPPNDEGDEFGYKGLMQRVSTILMGSRSYRQILDFGEWAWGGKKTYVFTSQPLTTTRDDILFVNEDAKRFMEKLKSQNLTQDIWLLGGAELVTSFAKEKLIDECIITVVPSTLREGIKLELPLEDYILQEAKQCSYEIVQNHYVRKTV